MKEFDISGGVGECQPRFVGKLHLRWVGKNGSFSIYHLTVFHFFIWLSLASLTRHEIQKMDK